MEKFAQSCPPAPVSVLHPGQKLQSFKSDVQSSAGGSFTAVRFLFPILILVTGPRGVLGMSPVCEYVATLMVCGLTFKVKGVQTDGAPLAGVKISWRKRN